MIYEAVLPEENLRQGDIFLNLPFIRIDLEKFSVILEDNTAKQISWCDVEEDEVLTLASIEKIDAIILSQDCDCERSPYITLISISEWKRNIKKDKIWKDEIIHLNQHGPSKMYLPPDNKFNIQNRMHIDIEKILNIRRRDLESLRNLRICRLNQEAMEHFREKVAYYFHRYAFTEYYPLNKKEMDEYEKDHKKKDKRLKFERRSYQV